RLGDALEVRQRSRQVIKVIKRLALEELGLLLEGRAVRGLILANGVEELRRLVVIVALLVVELQRLLQVAGAARGGSRGVAPGGLALCVVCLGLAGALGGALVWLGARVSRRGVGRRSARGVRGLRCGVCGGFLAAWLLAFSLAVRCGGCRKE